MADKAHELTDEKLAKMEKHLSAIYSRANEEIGVKWKDYLEKSDKKIDELQKLYDNAKDEKLKREYGIQLSAAKRNQTTMNKRFKDLTAQTAAELSNVNKTALAYINDQLPEVYTLNYNALFPEVDNFEGYSFTLTDANTVKYLSEADRNLLPYKKIDGRKDIRWNAQKLNAEVLQGILQGESMQNIAKRFKNVTEMNKVSAIRNARTTVTSAECKGRQDSYERAKDDGIDIKKEWMSTLDFRTRHSHALLDGKTAEIDKPFKTFLDSGISAEIMYPGDPNAEPELVYNCRCTTIADVGQEKAESRIARDDNGNSVLVQNMSYEEWYKWKTGKPFVIEPKKVEAVASKFNSNKIKAALGGDYDEFKQLVDSSKSRILFEKYSDEVKSITLKRNAGVYYPARDSVEFDIDRHKGQSKYSTLAHEMGHSFDKRTGNIVSCTFDEIEAVSNACGIRMNQKGRISSSDRFLNAMRKDKSSYNWGVKEDRIKVKREFNSAFNETAGVQDAFDGFFGIQKEGYWGHGERYYNRFYNDYIKNSSWGIDHSKELKETYKNLGFDASNQAKVKMISRDYETASELWANINSAYTVGGKELEYMEKYMPNACEEYLKIVEELENA